MLPLDQEHIYMITIMMEMVAIKLLQLRLKIMSGLVQDAPF